MQSVTKRVSCVAPLQRWASSAVAPSFKEVKFQKEEVASVMAELPEFEFYEMKGTAPYPYSRTLDSSIVIDAPVSKPLGKAAVEFAQLENGLKVASIDRGGLKASLGLFVSAGSRHETSSNFGVSHMTSLMAYKSTAHLSNLRTVKTLEQLGASNASTCSAGREHMLYQVDVMREYIPLVLPLMVGNVLFPRLLPWEVKATHGKVQQARDALASNPAHMLGEIGHKAAFCNNTLGFSPLASKRSMAYFTPETIRSFMLDHFAPERMVLVGVNVDATELSKWAMRSFVDYNAIPMKERDSKQAVYTGGDLRIEGASPLCHVAVGFESSSLGASDLATVKVLETLLGGGSATKRSVGGGGLSRLSQQVLRQNPHVHACSAFNRSYSDTGIFGVYGVCNAEKSGEMVTSVTHALAGLASVSSEELEGAKAVLKGKIFRSLDSDAALMNDIGNQLLHTGTYNSGESFASMVDEVTVESATAVAKKLLSSVPTVVATGDTHTVPHYASVVDALKV